MRKPVCPRAAVGGAGWAHADARVTATYVDGVEVFTR